jgi:hypothetical protein
MKTKNTSGRLGFDSAGNIIHLMTNPIKESGVTVKAYHALACCVEDTFTGLTDAAKKSDFDTMVRQPVIALKIIIQGVIDSCDKCDSATGSTHEYAQGMDCFQKTSALLCAIADIAQKLADWALKYGTDCHMLGENCYNALKYLYTMARKESEDVLRSLPSLTNGGQPTSEIPWYDNWKNLAWILGGTVAVMGATYMIGSRRGKRRR